MTLALKANRHFDVDQYILKKECFWGRYLVADTGGVTLRLRNTASRHEI